MRRVLIFLTISIFSSLFIQDLSVFASNERIDELDEMSNDELLSSVKLGKQTDLIKKFQKKEATRLYNDNYNPKSTGCNVETMRNGEVVIISIPSDLLFIQNSTELISTASKYLDPIKRYLKRPDMYRVLLVMHTDDTGSVEYTDNLSISRVEEIFNWFIDNGCNTTYLFPTASGSSDPLPGKSNNSIENRAKNRRLEIYLIPGETMVETAKKGIIAF